MYAMLMGLKTIAPRELHARMTGDAMTVVDLNTRQSWLQARVPGARNLEPAVDRRCHHVGYPWAPADILQPVVPSCKVESRLIPAHGF